MDELLAIIDRHFPRKSTVVERVSAYTSDAEHIQALQRTLDEIRSLPETK